ncbi:podocan [Dunckerocampus dactyliophorus]|uniref:podocan n=1 Tax=Dunckerocampus dactyliophorus TaxID=161453 RepID=UPI002404C387|nr:podocan [Dunckerocampus dactyliophorus]
MEVLTLLLMMILLPVHSCMLQIRPEKLPVAVGKKDHMDAHEDAEVDQTETVNKEEDVDANLREDLMREEQESRLVAGIIPLEIQTPIARAFKQRKEELSNTLSAQLGEESEIHILRHSSPHHPPASFGNPASDTKVTLDWSPPPPVNHKSISLMEDVLTEVLQSPGHYSEHTGPNIENGMVRNLLRTPVRKHHQNVEREKTNTVGVEGATGNPKKAKLTKLKTFEMPPVKTKKHGRKKKVKKHKKTKKTTKKQHFPYFLDNYCPPDCACYGGVVQCSDKALDKIPYGIPYSVRYVLLMNNQIDSIPLDLLRDYVSMEFLVLTNNRLTDGTIEGAFEGIPALKRLYLDRNLLVSVPPDLPGSLEELRLDNNGLSVMSEASWAQCPGLLVLSLRNNTLGHGSGCLLDAVLSPLYRLQTLNLDLNQLTSVPLRLPLSVKELYLRGNLIEHFSGKAFDGKSQLVVLDLSANRLTNKGLPKDALLNASNLESLNLEGNRLKQVPRHLPLSLKTLNLECNLISSVKQGAFNSLKNLEHLGLARNKISKVVPGAFRSLSALHQLDLSHNTLNYVPRQLPQGLHSVALTHNKIHTVPRDAFCWGPAGSGLSRLVRVQLESNLIDMAKLDSKAFRCLRGFQVVHFH